MKQLSFLLVLLCSYRAHANTYYFSARTGNDLHTALQARSMATPWKSLNKLNAFFANLQAGDSVLFRRGEFFTGQIRVTKSGIANDAIVFGAYGSGSRPIINGFTTLLDWKSTGLQSWEATCPATTKKVNMVTTNGKVQPMGRYPNSTASNKGYLTLESHSGKSQITDQQLTATTDWTGAEAIIRKNRWTLDRNPITKHAGNTITYTSGSDWEPSDNFGYFIQNHPKTLDQFGEWYYDVQRKKLKVYFGTYAHVDFDIKATIVDTLVWVQGQHYVTFDNLTFNGANMAAFVINRSNNVRITNCDISFSGLDGIIAANTVNLGIENSTIINTNNNAITTDKCSYTKIRSNIIKNTGTLEGMGRNDASYEAIIIDGANSLVEFNDIDNTGYIPITFHGSSVVIKNNCINQFAFVKDDGGGIYTWNNYANPVVNTGQKIIGNIILNGRGAGAGTNDPAYLPASGIYIDDNAGNLEISSNTVAHCSLAGFFNHNAHNIILDRNTFFNNQMQFQVLQNGLVATSPVRNNVITKNINFAKKQGQLLSKVESIVNDIQSFGRFDSNYYCRPVDETRVIFTSYVEAGKTLQQYHNLESWQSLFRKDPASKKTPARVPSYTLNNLVGANKYGNGSFSANAGGLYCYSSTGNCTTGWITGKLDGGALQYTYRKVAGATNSSSYIIIGIGAVTANKNYILRFSAITSVANKTVGTFLRKSQAPYNDLGTRKYGKLTNTRTENEFLFSSPVSETDASIVLELDEREDFSGWLDNVQLYEANVTSTNPDDYIRFEYNATKTRRTVALNGTYVDARNNRYASTVIIDPYSSIVLVKQPPAGMGQPIVYRNNRR